MKIKPPNTFLDITPIVSVLMPVYNAADFLNEAIDSILNQTYNNFLFYIIDDCSTDNSVDVIEKYKDKRIRFIKKSQNTGLANTLNVGLKNISTKYIARMDNDDIAVPERLELQVGFMENNPEIGVCGGHLQLFGSESGIRKYPLTHDQIFSTMIFQPALAHPATIIRKDILDKNKIKYSEAIEYIEDFLLWNELKCYTRFANLDKVLLRYRKSDYNMTVRNSGTYFERVKKVYKKVLSDDGIPHKNEEIALHCLPNKDFKISQGDIKKFYLWLKKLKKFNAANNTYPSKYFNMKLKFKWERLFYSLPEYGLNYVLKYIQINRGISFKHLRYLLGHIKTKFYKNSN